MTKSSTQEANKAVDIVINETELAEICRMPIKDFISFGGVLNNNADGMYIYKDNDCEILAVAHLDTVQNSQHFKSLKVGDDRLFFNSNFDDRLGAYIVLKLLPQLGIKTDILLTEGEETGKSTAKYFKTTKKYKWIFSFDRMGTDVVMYGFDDEPTRKLLRKYYFRPEKGMFSDIALLTDLGCKGFNFGTGYYNNHAKTAFAIESHILHNVGLFYEFYAEQKDILLPHVNIKVKPWESDWNYGYSSSGHCDKCGENFSKRWEHDDWHRVCDRVEFLRWCDECKDYYNVKFNDKHLHGKKKIPSTKVFCKGCGLECLADDSKLAELCLSCREFIERNSPMATLCPVCKTEKLLTVNERKAHKCISCQDDTCEDCNAILKTQDEQIQGVCYQCQLQSSLLF